MLALGGNNRMPIGTPNALGQTHNANIFVVPISTRWYPKGLVDQCKGCITPNMTPNTMGNVVTLGNINDGSHVGRVNFIMLVSFFQVLLANANAVSG